MNLFAHIYARLQAPDGQTMAETAVLMALVFLVVFVAVVVFAGSLNHLWQSLGSELPGN